MIQRTSLVVFLVEPHAKPLLQFQHGPVLFVAGGQAIVRIGLKQARFLGQPRLNDLRMRAGEKLQRGWI